jgi:hypothetical protein
MTGVPTSAAQDGPRLPTVLRPLGWGEDVLAGLLAHPLLTLQIVLFWLISWGGLGADLGLDDLFWHESATVQFAVGISVGLLFAQVLFIRYLVDTRRRSGKPPSHPEADDASDRRPFRGLVRFLLIAWPLTLLALVVPKVIFLRDAQSWQNQSPMLVGVAASALGALLLVTFIERTGLRARAQRSWFFRMMPGVAWGYLPASEHALHAMALILGLLFAAGIAAAGVLDFLGHTLITPYLAMCLIFAVVNGIYGLLTSQMRGLQHLALLFLIASAVVLNSDTFDPDHAYRMSFPNMAAYYDAARQAANEADVPPPSATFVRLDEERHEVAGQRPTDHYRALCLSKEHSAEAAGLIDSEQPLRAMYERWQQRHPGTKPRLVIVCTSGGGIRAAVWTTVVLEGLEETVPGLRDHIRMITGASGGMVGAGLYVADFERPSDPKDVDPETGLSTFSKLLARDSLTPAVQTMLLNDLPRVWVPRPMDRDRGRALEQAWFVTTRRPGDNRSPLEKSFAELRDDERQGRRPSLVFSPMLVEDSRRLIISNLSLDHLTMSYSQQLAGSSFAEGGVTENDNEPERANLRTQRSLSAVEFFRLFPQASGFQVSTAARMNASFPLVSPAINLPTHPPRRVVDTGYYDNYGTHVATMWLLHHQEAIRRYASGVLLVEIRAYRNGYARRHFQDQERLTEQIARSLDPESEPRGEARSRDLISQSLEGLFTPAEAVLTTRDRASMYRNDELVDLVDRELNTEERNFFTTAVFECHKDAALSWMLSRGDARNIACSFWRTPDHGELRNNIQRRIDPIRQWFGNGGK